MAADLFGVASIPACAVRTACYYLDMTTTQKTVRLSGNTFPVRATLREEGASWDAATKSWTLDAAAWNALIAKCGAAAWGRESKIWNSLTVTMVAP